MIADDGRDVPRDTLKITTRRWLASKIAPRRYGERLAAEVSGPGGGPIEARAAPAPMVPAEVAKEVRKLIADAEAAAGLPPGTGDDAQRLRAVLTSGAPVHPDLYEVLWSNRDG